MTVCVPLYRHAGGFSLEPGDDAEEWRLCLARDVRVERSAQGDLLLFRGEDPQGRDVLAALAAGWGWIRDSAGAGDSGEERRRHPRTRFPALRAAPGGEVLDISPGGICLSPRPDLEPGARCRVTIQSIGGRAREGGEAEVVWVHPGRAGLRWLTPPSTERR